MSNTTPNLDLFKWDTTNRTDLASKFNIPVSMNENWDKLDTAVANKVDKVTGKGLSTNDYTTAEKQKLAGIETQANKTVVDVSLSETSTNPVQNKKVYEALAEKQEQIDALVEENSTLKKQQLKGQASGSSIQLTDSAEGLEIENVKLKGAMSQNTYNGYNLLNSYLKNQTVNGVTVTYNSESQEITLNGTCTADNTYFNFNSNIDGITVQSNGKLYGKIVYVSGSSEGYLALRAFKEDYSGIFLIVNTDNGLTQNISGSVTCTTNTIFNRLSIRANSNSVFNNLKIKLMFSTENVNYEPFCGAQVSPNKDYPQEVHCVTGTNNVNVQRKNIFPFPFTDAATTRSGVTVTVDSKNQTMSASGTTTSANFTWYFFNGNLEIKETYKLSSNLTASLLKIGYIKKGETARTWTTLASTSIFNDGDVIKQIYIQPSSTGTTIAYKDIYVQLEKGSTATEHTLYEEQNAPLSLGNIELYDGDKIQISFINKAGYKKVTGASIIKKWKSGVINGSETIQLMDTLTNTIRYAVKDILNPKALQSGKVYSNYLICYDSQRSNYNFNNTANDMEAIHIRDDQFGLGLKIKKTTASTVERLKTWLQSHNLNYTYELETPETTPITDTTLLNQLETLINMKTYKQIPNIEATGSDLSPVLEFQYSKDLQTVIDNMQAQILS